MTFPPVGSKSGESATRFTTASWPSTVGATESNAVTSPTANSTPSGVSEGDRAVAVTSWPASASA
jgi:hypothetical protein